MKKLMTVIAVLFIAASAQAASVSWTWATQFIDVDWNGLNGTVAFYLSATPPAAGATGFDSFTQTDNSGNYANNTYSADHTALNGQTGWMRFINNGYYIETSFAISGLVGGGNPADGAAIDGWVATAHDALTASFGDANGLDMTAQVATWTAVPEPTSMALLALGAAAIGLRRRFRK